ncbi:Eco57I restriction-modification methylase domain-containing protein [Janibacter sp. UYMM211]|uniref:Eco57I restriction-modification methylase domain-containing protein n=1 Tax=Janibacter sp. UYMM211 TaxID=3156342 RepID=UPI00339B2923
MDDLGEALLAFDIDPAAVATTRHRVVQALTAADVAAGTARRLARTWVRRGDFLRAAPDLPPSAWVIGNPPYRRVEDVDREQMAAYRATWPTMTGRADVYVGFLEAGLRMLQPGGTLAVVCADRWMRNQYGAALRELVGDAFAVRASIAMHGVDAFDDPVAAYPAITVIEAGEQGPALVCEAAPRFDARAAERLRATHRGGPPEDASGRRHGEDPDFTTAWTKGWFTGRASWPDADPAHLEMLSALEARLPTLEESGARVAIGAATGADEVFITHDPGRVEPERLLKAVTAKEVRTGRITWARRHLVNPWDEDGLVALEDYPGLAAYLVGHEQLLRGRHVAVKNPARWWRTIDRVHPRRASRPKLLVPDLTDRVLPVYDHGEYYPGHSLSYITSETWDLEVLGGLLMSDVATMFVRAYSVRMAGGHLRLGPQYLRRIRVPLLEDIPAPLASCLRRAFREHDTTAADVHARVAYGLDPT